MNAPVLSPLGRNQLVSLLEREALTAVLRALASRVAMSHPDFAEGHDVHNSLVRAARTLERSESWNHNLAGR